MVIAENKTKVGSLYKRSISSPLIFVFKDRFFYLPSIHLVLNFSGVPLSTMVLCSFHHLGEQNKGTYKSSWAC
jgi:hypothetical protein